MKRYMFQSSVQKESKGNDLKSQKQEIAFADGFLPNFSNFWKVFDVRGEVFRVENHLVGILWDPVSGH